MDSLLTTDYREPSRLPLATSASILIHLGLFLGLSTSLAMTIIKDPSVAVTVTLTPSTQAPTDASHFANSNQMSNAGLANELTTGQTQASLAIMREETEQGPSAEALFEEVALLQGEVAEIQQAQNTRLGSVAARRALDADYLRRWTRRVEAVGNAAINGASGQRASGDVRLLVVVSKPGELLDVRLLNSSGFSHLDRAALQTVRDAAPYPKFPPALAQQVDKLEIVRIWQFRP
ncbi:MAG: hypothetical protein CBB81_08085 [Cellvibrionales bacterium TMED21]|nr:hypothetical protein [Halieaceae bacterium]OUT65009.1 MAG: hypothetical protein CBB81_08085 [Cellvibrionales bacterium TMED21]